MFFCNCNLELVLFVFIRFIFKVAGRMGPMVSTWKLVLNPTTYKMLPQLLPNAFVRGDNSEARIRPIFSLSQFCLSSSLYAMWRNVIAKARRDDPLLQQPIYEVSCSAPDLSVIWDCCLLRKKSIYIAVNWDSPCWQLQSHPFKRLLNDFWSCPL